MFPFLVYLFLCEFCLPFLMTTAWRLDRLQPFHSIPRGRARVWSSNSNLGFSRSNPVINFLLLWFLNFRQASTFHVFPAKTFDLLLSGKIRWKPVIENSKEKSFFIKPSWTVKKWIKLSNLPSFQIMLTMVKTDASKRSILWYLPISTLAPVWTGVLDPLILEMYFIITKLSLMCQWPKVPQMAVS